MQAASQGKTTFHEVVGFGVYGLGLRVYLKF